jgi:hypothetical protein
MNERRRAPLRGRAQPSGSDPKPQRRRGSRAAGSDPLSKLVRAFVAILTEAYKLVREMLVIPAQLWLAVAEVAGRVVLRGWRLVRPVIVAALRLVVAAERFAQRQLTPKRAAALVAIAALGALVASQWVDYRAISVGNAAYSGGIETVAPAPDVASEHAGDAHSWVMVPLAVGGLLAVAAAFAGRRRAAWLLVGVGAAAIAISLLVDMPKGLDEGSAAVAYEGAKASLLEGFWLQIACGAALIACGLLLGAYARPATATARTSPAPRRRLGALAKRLRPGRPAARPSA